MGGPSIQAGEGDGSDNAPEAVGRWWRFSLGGLLLLLAIQTLQSSRKEAGQ